MITLEIKEILNKLMKKNIYIIKKNLDRIDQSLGGGGKI